MRTIRKIEKNMKRLLFLASLVAATLLAGCSGKGCPGPERNLVVSGGGAADLRLGMTSRYTVFGSGDYEAVSSDPSVATVAVDGRTLSVTGHAVGRATVTLTDLPSDERVEIAVTVVDFYLCLFVSAGTDDDRTVLRRNDGLFLWANDVCEYRLVRNTAHEWWGTVLGVRRTATGNVCPVGRRHDPRADLRRRNRRHGFRGGSGNAPAETVRRNHDRGGLGSTRGGHAALPATDGTNLRRIILLPAGSGTVYQESASDR